MPTETKIAPNGSQFLDKVRIPEGQIGEYKIEHFTAQPNHKFMLANLRGQLMAGHEQAHVSYPHKTKWHRLSYSGGTWMTDSPMEQYQHMLALGSLYGHVLIGGLGLGLAVNLLAQQTRIKSITVVEISHEVLELVHRHIKDPFNIVRFKRNDLLNELPNLKANRQTFDSAFYDTWQMDGEHTFLKDVIPLREASRGVVPDRSITCWNEDIMRGQVAIQLHTRHLLLTGGGNPQCRTITMDDLAHPRNKKDIWMQWSAPYFRALEAGKIKDARKAVAAYADMYGRPNWEERWLKLL